MTDNQNAAVYFVDRHRSSNYADKLAFIESDGGQRSLSYRSLADQSACIADIYRRHGLRREDRAVMLMLDQIEFPIIFWGSLKAGVVPVPINTLLSTDVYQAIINDSRARALFVSDTLYPKVAPLLANHPSLSAVFVIGGKAPAGCFSFDDEFSISEPSDPVIATADEVAFWLYSSGSTGQPKGVRHVHGSLKATADTYADKVLGIGADDVMFSVAKMFFAYGLGNAMTFPMAVGATTVLLGDRPTPQSVSTVFREHEPSVFYGVPTLYAAMVAELGNGQLAGSKRLRRCVSAGEALPEEIGKRWKRIVGVDILDGVGSTEMLHIFLSNAPDDVVYGTSGTAVPGYDLRLVDEQGADVEVGAIGELLVNGPSAADGYWNQRDKTRATFEGQWTRTGDKYEKRADGRLIYCGRTDDMFKVSGIWVSPFEVEQALIAHPEVLEAAVVAARDADGLEKPKAFVVLKSDSTGSDITAALKAHVKDKIGRWKYPRWIEIADDLPKTATGKIQRFKLRAGLR